MLTAHELIEETIQLRLEDCLKASQHKVSPGCCVDKETKMRRDEHLRQKVAVEARKNGELTSEPVSKRVNQR